MKFRPEIEYQPRGPGRKYCAWTRGTKYRQCKWLTGYCWVSMCELFETPCCRDDNKRVLRCPQCVAAQKEMEE